MLLPKTLSEPLEIQSVENWIEEKMGAGKFSVSGITFLDTSSSPVSSLVTFLVNPLSEFSKVQIYNSNVTLSWLEFVETAVHICSIQKLF